MALWDIQLGSSGCGCHNVAPSTQIQVQVTSVEMVPVDPRRGMRDWDKAERQSMNDGSSSRWASRTQSCWETAGATVEHAHRMEGAGWIFLQLLSSITGGGLSPGCGRGRHEFSERCALLNTWAEQALGAREGSGEVQRTASGGWAAARLRSHRRKPERMRGAEGAARCCTSLCSISRVSCLFLDYTAVPPRPHTCFPRSR